MPMIGGTAATGETTHKRVFTQNELYSRFTSAPPSSSSSSHASSHLLPSSHTLTHSHSPCATVTIRVRTLLLAGSFLLLSMILYCYINRREPSILNQIHLSSVKHVPPPSSPRPDNHLSSATVSDESSHSLLPYLPLPPPSRRPYLTATASSSFRLTYPLNEHPLSLQIYGIPPQPIHPICAHILPEVLEVDFGDGPMLNFRNYAIQEQWKTNGCDYHLITHQTAEELKRVNMVDEAIQYMLELKSTEDEISSRLNRCIQEQTCDWLANKKKYSVVIAHWKENITWVDELDRSKYEIALYSRLGSALANPRDRYYVPHNFGEEGAVYLHYILLNYDTANFSEYTIFLHGHEWSWHHSDATGDGTILEKLKYYHLDGDYYPFRSLQWRHYSCTENRVVKDYDGWQKYSRYYAWWAFYEDLALRWADQSPQLPYEREIDHDWPKRIDAKETSAHQTKELKQPPPKKRVLPPMNFWRPPPKDVCAPEVTQLDPRFQSPYRSNRPHPTASTSHSRLLYSDLGHRVCYHCCGQFIVHRSRILAHPKAYYQAIYDRFWNAPKAYNLLEPMWDVLFGELPRPTILKPDQYEQLVNEAGEKRSRRPVYDY